MAKQQATYQLASSANYKFGICKIGFNNYDPLAYYNKENFPDVEVTRPGTDTDLELLHNNYLMTVNGYIYSTEYIGGKLYIPNATLSMIRSRANAMGMINFTNLGTISKVKITPDMITTDPVLPAYEKIMIAFPVEVKKPILIMAGYLVFENPEYFYRISDNMFVLRLDRLNYVERLYELNRYRDIFKELDVPVSNTNDSMVDGGVIRSEAVIKKFLSLHNSFLVNLDADNLTVAKIYTDKTSVPLNFRTEYPPILPLIVGYGKVTEYFQERSTEGKHNVVTQDGYYNNHVFSAQSYRDIAVYNSHRLPGTTYRLSPGFFLDISVDK